ncbi:BMC domain-containing protein [Clostridium sp. CF011]|uniref:BMC domain-containing protein n=1 Tax=Clostridium sp. CF011 TaxID=2843318 RepID=UPI001C0E2915|nr:BMC domain-containing protein [Clostridium sp. CF011]MBU3092663.1 BMC domain-containing protein [Clostridium sp. CF011]WAG71454.1 BMC domain-containing protein [Clostridium sp. CF011]
MYKGALGLIEVHGYLGAIEAADVALKTSNVNLIGCEIVDGGLVTVKIKGDVSSVKAAVEAAEIAVTKLNILVVAHVIPGPDLSVWNTIVENTSTKDCDHKECSEEVLVVESKKIKNVNQNKKTQEIKAIEFGGNTLSNSTSLKEQLESEKVNELRTLARSLDLDNMTKKQIKFAKKDRLVEEIVLFYQRRSK